jgi:hypothetical protein
MNDINQQLLEAKKVIRGLECELEKTRYDKGELRSAHRATRDMLKIALLSIKDTKANDCNDVHHFVRTTEDWGIL